MGYGSMVPQSDECRFLLTFLLAGSFFLFLRIHTYIHTYTRTYIHTCRHADKHTIRQTLHTDALSSMESLIKTFEFGS